MEIPNDFRELLSSFNAGGVEDLLVRATPENAQRVLAALEAFGFGSLGLTAGDFCAPDRVVQLGHPPVRVDLLTSLDGVSWEEAAREAEIGALLDESVPVIGRAAFIANKRATGRPSDVADLEALGES